MDEEIGIWSGYSTKFVICAIFSNPPAGELERSAQIVTQPRQLSGAETITENQSAMPAVSTLNCTA